MRSPALALKQTYHELGEVNHSTMFWVTLPKDSTTDDRFWISLKKIFRYVQKGSGRIVFHMPRKCKAWKDEGVKLALESFGLYKVSFDLNGEKTTVATNDESIREYLNPHHSPSIDTKESSDPSTKFSDVMCAAWQKSCEEAEALYNQTLA